MQDQNTESPFYILVDGSSYLHRAFHALPPLSNSKGQPTGAIFGVINMLRKLIKDYQPTHIAIIFDSKAKTFRHELYPNYKAHRPKMHDDLRAQIEPIYEIIRAMGLPLLVIDGVEADDVIGTLAKKLANKKINTLISTGDKDMSQLVTEHITLVNTMTNKTLGVNGIKEKYGIPPELFIDYLTLIGDTSDNIPGVEKVGPKTAVKWLAQYGSLDELIEHADEIKGKVGENFREFLSQIPLTKKLTTIDCDVELNIHISDLTLAPANTEKLIELFSELEFNVWHKELLEKSTTAENKNYKNILTEKDFFDWLEQLKNSDLFSFDLETTDLDYMEAKIVGFSFAIQPTEAIYIPVGHDYLGAPKQLELETVLDYLRPILEDITIKKLGHNLKYDKEVLANYDINLLGIAYDTMLESYILNSTASRHNLDALALKYLNYNTVHYEDVAGKGAKQITFNQVPLEQAGFYAAEDSDISLQLHHYFWPQIEINEKTKNVLLNIEIPLLSILSRMERQGVLIDAPFLRQQSAELKERLLKLEKEAFTLADENFNLDSPKQLRTILYEKLKLPMLKKTPTGQPSTAEAVLQELALDFSLPKLVLEYRKLSKLKSTYTDSLPEQINLRTGRVHTSYHQAVTATGRLSSSNPNLQNIPIRTEAGRRIRQAFIAPQGYKLLAADYSQIELRIMAHLSQDEGLLNAFSKGIDIHTATAAEVFGITIDTVTKDQRRKAKAINFGLIYGMSTFGLAKQLGVERTAAQTYIDSYFAQYPNVKNYMAQTRQFARENGYVETIFGRRLYVPDITAHNTMSKQAAERAAINGPMQGTAADIIKLAMIAIDQWIQKTAIKINMIMQVHDELVFEIEEAQLKPASDEIEKYMSEAANLSVPLTVDIGIGNNWDEAH